MNLFDGLQSHLRADVATLNNILKIKSERIADLENKLYSTKRFMNMVIHDLRGPTTSIKGGLAFIVTQFSEIK